MASFWGEITIASPFQRGRRHGYYREARLPRVAPFSMSTNSNVEQEQKKLTFDQLPEVVGELRDEIAQLKGFIMSNFSALQAPEPPKVWMDLAQLCEYLPDKPSKATVYGWVCARTIPYHKKTKKLSFLKSEIDAWIIKSGHATAEEIRETALDSLGYRKGGLR